MTMIIGCDLAGAQAFDVAGITNTVGARPPRFLPRAGPKCGGRRGPKGGDDPNAGTDGTFPFFLLRKEWDRAAGEPGLLEFPQAPCDI